MKVGADRGDRGHGVREPHVERELGRFREPGQGHQDGYQRGEPRIGGPHLVGEHPGQRGGAGAPPDCGDRQQEQPDWVPGRCSSPAT